MLKSYNILSLESVTILEILTQRKCLCFVILHKNCWTDDNIAYSMSLSYAIYKTAPKISIHEMKM